MIKINYSARLKSIRPYVDFDYNLRDPLSSAAKHQINRYFDYISKLKIREYQIYRSKDPRKLKAVQDFAQHDDRFYHLKVAFVPNAGEPLKIKINKKLQVTGISKHLEQITIRFDPERIATEGAFYVEDTISEAPQAKSYVVMAGEFEVPTATRRNDATNYIMSLASRYDSDKFDENDKNSHHYRNWMFGVIGYNYRNQKAFGQYRADKKKYSKEKSRAQINENKKEARRQVSKPKYWLNHTTRKAKIARPPQPNGWETVSERAYYKAIYEDKYVEIKDRSKS